MFDVLALISRKNGYTIKAIGIPKNREIKHLESGKLDANPLAKEWVSNPEDFEFADVIIDARDVLFSLREKPIKFVSVKDLHGKTIGTHLGYSYPLLEQDFKGENIVRHDSDTEFAMLRITLVGWTDATVINELVGQWLIKGNSNWHEKFVVSKKIVGGFDYRIMFSKKWELFVEVFNKELTIMKENGELDRIISKYK